MSRLILASTSRYRRELLSRLRIDFEAIAPDVDETPQAREAPAELAERLAIAKAGAIAGQHPDAWVLGSDQVAELDGRAVGKSGDFERARAQLRAASGRDVHFHTAFCLTQTDSGRRRLHRDLTVVRFRALTDAEIDRYLDAERPFDCAGSFKCEGLGISLFEAIESRDPTALVGLPLIALAAALREAGFAIP